MNDNEIERQLRELRELRRQGEITPEEAFRRHEAIVTRARPAQPEATAASVAEVAATEAAPARLRPEARTARSQWIIIGAVFAALLAVGLVYAALRTAGVFEDEDAPTDGGGSTAQQVPVQPPTLLTAIPGTTPTTSSTTCYRVASPDDRVEVISVDPPLNGPLPTTTLRVSLRYNLVSHERARLILYVDDPAVGAGARTLGPEVTVSRGNGVVSLTRSGTMPPGEVKYFIYLQPTVDAYRGFSCWSPIFILPLPYAR